MQVICLHSVSNSSIWPTGRTLSGATTPDQSGLGSNGNEGILRIPQSSSITGASPSDCLVSYKGHKLGCVSYPSAGMQLAYCTALSRLDCVRQAYIYIYTWSNHRIGEKLAVIKRRSVFAILTYICSITFFKHLVIVSRAPTTININVILARSWYLYCFLFSSIFSLASAGTPKSLDGKFFFFLVWPKLRDLFFLDNF